MCYLAKMTQSRALTGGDFCWNPWICPFFFKKKKLVKVILSPQSDRGGAACETACRGVASASL